MEKYKVRALINFDDLDANGEKRLAGKSEWITNKERYLFLKEHNAVELLEIIPEKIETPKKTTRRTTKKK